MNTLTLGRTILKQTLEANVAYQTLLAWPGITPTIYRTFANNVDALVPMPYVTLRHYTGGQDLRDPRYSSDVLWKVTGHCSGEEDVDALHEVIFNALHNQEAVLGAVTGVAAISRVFEMYPFEDRYVRQNREFFQVGGIYRLQLVECVEN